MFAPILAFALAVLPPSAVPARSGVALDAFTDRYDALLESHVRDGLVDYAALAADPSELHAVCGLAGGVRLDETSDTEQKAFYINAYNLFAIRGVVNRWPIETVIDDKTFFEVSRYRIARKSYTLSGLENDLIRRRFGDPRNHFALVCAARSCPPLPTKAYRPGRFDAQLRDVTERALNDPSFIRVDHDAGTVALSPILDWYREDFPGGETDAGLVSYVNGFRESPIPASFAVTFYAYDWTLNAR